MVRSCMVNQDTKLPKFPNLPNLPNKKLQTFNHYSLLIGKFTNFPYLCMIVHLCVIGGAESY